MSDPESNNKIGAGGFQFGDVAGGATILVHKTSGDN